MKPIVLSGVAIALTITARAIADEPAQPYTAVGQAGLTCVKYLQARDAEAQARPPDAPPGRILPAVHHRSGLAEGALSAANRLDSANPTVGGKSVPGNRMDWLENYCRDHALELFVNAAVSLRAYLQQQNE